MAAYNNYNPYNPQPYQVYQQPMQIQNGGLVSVRNIDEARNYPVAPGTSVTFKDESSSYIYTKTQGFSQLDRPIFEKYRLVKEEDITQQAVVPEYALKADLEAIKQEILDIKTSLNQGAEDE